MDRYSKVLNKNKREIVLLKSFPCMWGKCRFCDYIEDNDTKEDEINKMNKAVLKNITGEFGQLEVINSGSVFEIPEETLKNIKNKCIEKNIKKIYFESYYRYKDRLDEIREKFKGMEVVFKCGIETFDDDFRNKYLKKGVIFNSPEEVATYFDNICLMVGIKGQTKNMIRNDMEILQKYFKHGCINVFINNTTDVKRDEELVVWFKEEFGYLDQNEDIEILWNNTDFGVGD